MAEGTLLIFAAYFALYFVNTPVNWFICAIRATI